MSLRSTLSRSECRSVLAKTQADITIQMGYGRVSQWFLRRKPSYSAFTTDAGTRKVRNAGLTVL